MRPEFMNDKQYIEYLENQIKILTNKLNDNDNISKRNNSVDSTNELKKYISE